MLLLLQPSGEPTVQGLLLLLIKLYCFCLKVCSALSCAALPLPCNHPQASVQPRSLALGNTESSPPPRARRAAAVLQPTGTARCGGAERRSEAGAAPWRRRLPGNWGLPGRRWEPFGAGFCRWEPLFVPRSLAGEQLVAARRLLRVCGGTVPSSAISPSVLLWSRTSPAPFPWKTSPLFHHVNAPVHLSVFHPDRNFLVSMKMY